MAVSTYHCQARIPCWVPIEAMPTEEADPIIAATPFDKYKAPTTADCSLRLYKVFTTRINPGYVPASQIPKL